MRTALLLLALLLCLSALPAGADTGTYKILDYRVRLTPHADGTVDIDYLQSWRVTGGHIPWVTVGLPNGDFTITKSGLAVSRIAPQSEGDWSGVRIDLNRDYQPGQTFFISFSVKQNKLFYAQGDTYKLDFSPGWYDRAVVDSLTLTVKYFVKPDAVAADPPPTSKTDTELVWGGQRLAEGEHFTIHVSFPKASAPQAIPEGALRGPERRGGGEQAETGGKSRASDIAGTLVFIAFVVFIVVVVPLLRWLSRPGRRRGPYTGGSVFWGVLGSILDGTEGGGGRHTGGGGGFGGGGFSCACACVSCACACACAGGGGAGCSRKLHHTCPHCEKLRSGAAGDA